MGRSAKTYVILLEILVPPHKMFSVCHLFLRQQYFSGSFSLCAFSGNALCNLPSLKLWSCSVQVCGLIEYMQSDSRFRKPISLDNIGSMSNWPLFSRIVIPSSWYRAQKPLKPGNTKKIRKNYKIPHPGSGPEYTKKYRKIWPGMGDFVVFRIFFVFVSYFRAWGLFELYTRNTESQLKNILMPLFLMGCFPVDFQEAKRPIRTKSMKRPIKVGQRPINEGKRPIKAKVLVGVSVGSLMGCFRAPTPLQKTAPLKRPI